MSEVPGAGDEDKRDYDVIIVGGGPAGLAAAVYASRARMSTLVLETMMPGGQAASTSVVENYPGFAEIGGPELAAAMEAHATKFGAVIEYDSVLAIDDAGRLKIVRGEGGEYFGKTVIVATGARSLPLGIPREGELRGRGVSYCATCDGAFFRDKVVAVVGGGDSAIDEGLFLTRFATKVYVIHRRNTLRAEPILQERAFANRRMEFVWDSVVESFGASRDVLEEVVLRNVKTGRRTTLPLDGLFVYIGMKPNSDLVAGLIALDERGHILTNERMATNVPGVFAAGDVRKTPLRQVVTAVADGAIAAMSAYAFIAEHSTAATLASPRI